MRRLNTSDNPEDPDPVTDDMIAPDPWDESVGRDNLGEMDTFDEAPVSGHDPT